MPLEFQLDSSLGTGLTFSRHSTLNPIHSLTLEPNSFSQVFIFYQPQLKRKQPLELNDSVSIVEKIHVTCRLVKDFRRTLILKATLRAPTLSVCTFNEQEGREGFIDQYKVSIEPMTVGEKKDGPTKETCLSVKNITGDKDIPSFVFSLFCFFFFFFF
jgi:hypothetical protein